jgi:hypothetical protein
VIRGEVSRSGGTPGFFLHWIFIGMESINPTNLKDVNKGFKRRFQGQEIREGICEKSVSRTVRIGQDHFTEDPEPHFSQGAREMGHPGFFSYSQRRADWGSILAARRAGIQQANKATTARNSGSVVKVTRSCGRIP